jgi:hypothetical protein
MAGRGVALDFRAHGCTVHFRHHNVSDDEVRDGLQHHAEAHLSIFACRDVIVSR